MLVSEAPLTWWASLVRVQSRLLNKIALLGGLEGLTVSAVAAQAMNKVRHGEFIEADTDISVQDNGACRRARADQRAGDLAATPEQARARKMT